MNFLYFLEGSLSLFQLVSSLRLCREHRVYSYIGMVSVNQCL